MFYIGIDNGVSGSIGIVCENAETRYYKTPVIHCLDYTKKEKWIHRVNVSKLLDILKEFIFRKENVRVFIERPMVNPTMFNASLSAIRALEATLIILETLGLSYEFVDSKEWQKVMLPNGIKGTPKLKKASLSIGKRLFPKIEFKNDADSILLAEYMRRKNAGNIKSTRK